MRSQERCAWDIASFPGLPTVQFLITCRLVGRPGNEGTWDTVSPKGIGGGGGMSDPSSMMGGGGGAGGITGASGTSPGSGGAN